MDFLPIVPFCLEKSISYHKVQRRRNKSRKISRKKNKKRNKKRNRIKWMSSSRYKLQKIKESN